MVAAHDRIRYLWQAWTELVFPTRCAACRCFLTVSTARGQRASADLPNPEVHLRGVLCPACLGKCRWLTSPLCSRCGLMFTSREGDDHRCGECLAANGYYDRARSVGVYQAGLMSLVHQLKYRGRLALAAPMGRMLRDTFMVYWREATVDLVVPIPLHPRRLRRRGFNQAALLLRAWQRAAAREPAASAVPVAATHVLVRSRRTRSQTGLNRRERRRNMRGAFTVHDHDGIQHQHVLLLDDVFTTGATVEEAARTLLTAGAAAVDVLTFARTPR